MKINPTERRKPLSVIQQTRDSCLYYIKTEARQNRYAGFLGREKKRRRNLGHVL